MHEIEQVAQNPQQTVVQSIEKKKNPQGQLLTVLTPVSQVLWQAAAGWLVAHADRAVAVIHAVVLTSVQVAVGPREAFRASASWQT